MTWYFYIARATDGSLYSGITTNIGRRIWQHNHGKGASSLRGKTPVKLAYKEKFDRQSEAAQREREVKDWRKGKKEKLIMEKGLPRALGEGFTPRVARGR